MQQNQVAPSPWRFSIAGSIQSAVGDKIQLIAGDILLPALPQDGQSIAVRIATANLHQIASEIRASSLPSGQTIGAGQPGGSATGVFLFAAEDAAAAAALVGVEAVFAYQSQANNWVVTITPQAATMAAIASYVPSSFAGLLIVVDGSTPNVDGLYRWASATSEYVFVGG